MVDKALGVRERRANRIIAVMGPVAVAVAALIERDAVIFVAQRQADEVPGMRRQGAAMQEDDGRQMLVAPIEVMEPHPAEAKFMTLRQYHLAKAEAGPHGSHGKVLAVFLGGQAHGVGGSFGMWRRSAAAEALARKARLTLVLQCSRGMRRRHAPSFVIPAKAGIHSSMFWARI